MDFNVNESDSAEGILNNLLKVFRIQKKIAQEINHRFVGKTIPSFALLFPYSYVALFIVTIMAIRQKSVPSGKGVIVFIFKILLSYLIPGIVIGFLFALFQPIGSLLNSPYLIAFIVVSIGGVLFSLWISHVLSSSTKLYTADYENALEKDLASVNYQNASMDEVTNKMKDILRKNIESSSMNVYILTSQNELETAYSSNKL